MSKKDEIGWVYCLTNESIPDQVKVGQTANNPIDRAKQISGTGLPTPHKVVFAKKVSNYKQKERQLHKLLAKYEGRTNPKREFFKCKPEDVKLFFDLIDGEWLNIAETHVDTVSHVSKDTVSHVSNDTVIIKTETSKYLTDNSILMDGIDIKHVIKEKGLFTTKHSRCGRYNRSNNVIICEKGKIHRTLQEFIDSHYRDEKITKFNENEMNNLYYEYHGKWHPYKNLVV